MKKAEDYMLAKLLELYYINGWNSFYK